MFAAISVQKLNADEAIALVDTSITPEQVDEINSVETTFGEQAVTSAFVTATYSVEPEAPIQASRNVQLDAKLVNILQSLLTLSQQMKVLRRCVGCTIITTIVTLIAGTIIFILTLLLIWRYLE